MEGRQLLPQRQVFQDQFSMAGSANATARTTTMSNSSMGGSWLELA